MTGGLKGRPVDKAVIFGVSFGADVAFYFLCLAFLIGGLWLTQNLLRRADGPGLGGDPRQRDRRAVDGRQPRRATRRIAFAYSAGLMGVAGALFAHKIGYLAPDIFTVLLSIQFLLMVVVGGLGSLHGALYGAVFVALLPVLISEARDSVPGWLRPRRGRVRRHAGGDRRGRRRPLREAARRSSPASSG